jgi:hypothetical protein
LLTIVGVLLVVITAAVRRGTSSSDLESALREVREAEQTARVETEVVRRQWASEKSQMETRRQRMESEHREVGGFIVQLALPRLSLRFVHCCCCCFARSALPQRQVQRSCGSIVYNHQYTTCLRSLRLWSCASPTAVLVLAPCLDGVVSCMYVVCVCVRACVCV